MKFGADINAVNALNIVTDKDTGKIYRQIEYFTTGANSVMGYATKGGNTPLHLATLHSSSGLVAYLLENGADPYIANEDGELPIMIAAKHNCHADLHSIDKHECLDMIAPFIKHGFP
jgi:hypothetical protein